MEGEPVRHFVFDRTECQRATHRALQDPRPTSRIFEMTFGNGEWTPSVTDANCSTASHVRMMSVTDAAVGCLPYLHVVP